MSSCDVRPVWFKRMTWSTFVASNSRSFLRIVSGEPISPDLERLLRLGRVAPLLVQLPHIALARRRHAVASVVREAEDEEGPARRLGLRLLVRRRAHEGGHHRDVRILRIVGELGQVLGQVRVVLVDPGPRRLRRDELKAERSHAPAPRAADGLDIRAGHPERRVRLLIRLRDDVARREVEELAVELDALLCEARHQGPDRLLPHVALVANAPAEGVKLHRALRLADAELDAAAAQQIQRADALGDADRVIGRELDDPVAEPDALGALACRAEEHLWRRGVRVLLEEVMLHLPGIVVAEPVGQLDLRQRVLEQPILALPAPRPRKLMLVEDPESHRTPFITRDRR